MDKNIVAYIDLLAFSNHLRENTSDALRAMQNYNTILSTKIREEEIHPVCSYSEKLQYLAKNHSIDAFDYFLPFSDSVFLMSNDCSSFIKQLGSFVLHSFILTSRFYENPIDPSSPEKGPIINLSTNEECNYYPALFRGGLAYGEAFPIELYSILDKKPTKSKVITGKAVVDAVRLESSVKGPRLVFCNDVYEQLDDDARTYCRMTPENNKMYEILWPALIYIEQNKEHNIDEIHRVLNPAYNLWKAYNHMPYSYHYYNFIELIVASTIQFFDRKCGLKEVAKDEIKRLINNNDLKYKINLNNY